LSGSILRRTASRVACASASARAASSTFERVDPRRLRVIKRVRTGEKPWDIAAGDGWIWSSNERDGTVSKISPRTNRVVRTIKAGGDPSNLKFAFGTLWVG
jgi:virginiamycin B lyase